VREQYAMKYRGIGCARTIVLHSALLAGCASSPQDIVAGSDMPEGGAIVDASSPSAMDSGTTARPDTGASSVDSGSAPTPDGGAPIDASRPDTSAPGPDAAGPPADAGGCPTGAAAKVAPSGFWDSSNIPAARNLVMFKFLNRTNGKFHDSELYWTDTSSAGDGKPHSFAEAPTYDAPALSGRMYFYICSSQDAANYGSCSRDPTASKYFDWIEHNIFTQGGTVWAGNTTRVNEFGLKVAFRAQYASGAPDDRGEDYGTFCEDRAATFQRFIDEVPMEFRMLAQPPFAPYQIPEPGAGGVFGQYPNYYTAWEQQIWSSNGITLPMPSIDLTAAPLTQLPDLTAAIHRHEGGTRGSFNSDGTVASGSSVCTDPASFYATAPYDGYAKFWHDHALGGLTYGFNYDDDCGQSSYVWANNPQYVLVAIGW
jgi:hypothetical protein